MIPADLPPPSSAAYLLDLDGTLIDIAAAPDKVVVPPELPAVLARLRDRAGGALAIVSGRPIMQIDTLLGEGFAAAGQHGAEWRIDSAAEPTRAALPPLPAALSDAVAAIAVAHPGVLMERKRHGVAVHYRAVPAAGPPAHAALEAAMAAAPGFELLAAKMAWEVRPVGVNKGAAVRRLMASAPFAGRVPVYVGDDVTDLDGMAAARALGGVGLEVEPVFGAPAGVRAWIEGLAA